MKIKFSDLKLALDKIEKISDKGDIEVYTSDSGSSISLKFFTNENNSVEITLFESRLTRFALIKEEKWLIEGNK